jgi:hypothetical protein
MSIVCIYFEVKKIVKSKPHVCVCALNGDTQVMKLLTRRRKVRVRDGIIIIFVFSTYIVENKRIYII